MMLLGSIHCLIFCLLDDWAAACATHCIKQVRCRSKSSRAPRLGCLRTSNGQLIRDIHRHPRTHIQVNNCSLTCILYSPSFSLFLSTASSQSLLFWAKSLRVSPFFWPTTHKLQILSWLERRFDGRFWQTVSGMMPAVPSRYNRLAS